MASINSIMGGGGSTSSIFGNKNIISGLASGMDTEAMIENAVSGYKMKMEALRQQRTVVEWEQSAYRNLIDKMVAFNEKYMSFSTGNNLLSPSFFDSAVKMVAKGAYADCVSVSGKTNSDIQIHSVDNLAVDARYSVDTSHMAETNQASAGFDLNETVNMGTLEGSLELGYGGQTVRISFSKNDSYGNAQELADLINKKLADKKITFSDGKQINADERIKASVQNGEIQFTSVKQDDQNGVWISKVDGNLSEKTGIEIKDDQKDIKSFHFADSMVKKQTTADVIAEKGFDITIDGVTKHISGPDTKGQPISSAEFVTQLNQKLEAEFGKGVLEASNVYAGADGKLQLSFTAGSEVKKFSVRSAAGSKMHMESGLTNYVGANRTLGEMVKGGDWNSWRIKAEGNVTDTGDGKNFKDEAGNLYQKDDADGNYYRVDKDGKTLYDFRIGGKSAAVVTKDTAMGDLIGKVNSDSSLGIHMAYSEFTGKFSFTRTNSGAAGNTKESDPVERDGLSNALFGDIKFAGGQDATVTVSVNGEPKQTIHPHGNEFEIDGMKITLRQTFAEDKGAVTFERTTDADKILTVVKDLVKDYNEMASAIKSAYSTMPEQNSKGESYKPLTEKDRKDMSESEIKAFEEKAKKGILFGDRDLSNLYDGLRNSLSILGINGNDGNKLGLTTSFKDGATTLVLDENKFREAIENDPEKIKTIFTSSRANGDKRDGLLIGMKNTLDQYAKTTGADKGILIKKAGTPLAPTSVLQNELQREIGKFDKEIEKWQEKLADKIDYYNSKFTALEMMIAEMNNQSGMLMGLSGGGY